MSTRTQDPEAIARLREILSPGDTVYTVLRHRSASGMSRRISTLAITTKEGKPVIRDWSGLVARALGMRINRDDWGIVVSGTGMDMGFHLVYELGRVLFPDGFKVVDVARCQSCLDVPEKDGLGRVCKTCGGSGAVETPRRGRNGGYALHQEWL